MSNTLIIRRSIRLAVPDHSTRQADETWLLGTGGDTGVETSFLQRHILPKLLSPGHIKSPLV